MNLITEAELAEQFGISPAKAAELRRSRNWPHVRLGRFRVVYTPNQVEEVLVIQSSTTKRANKAPQQTGRSAKRSSGAA